MFAYVSFYVYTYESHNYMYQSPDVMTLSKWEFMNIHDRI